MTLQQIRYALTIAQTHSMNKATEKLFISQPTLTSAIKELERELGICIFLRTGRGMVPTNEGAEFLSYAAQIRQMCDLLEDKYHGTNSTRRRFCVSTQHYSFAVRAFVETVRAFGISKYELAIRETRTLDVIRDVGSLRSEIGILHISDYNRRIISRYLADEHLQFHPLVSCRAFVYLRKGHPLADRPSLSLKELEPYPCIAFEQGDGGSFSFAEEILPDNIYPRLIRTSDRATTLNLMTGLDGYTLCPGIVCEELNGSGYVAVPFRDEGEDRNGSMEIGYLTKKQNIISKIGRAYIGELRKSCGASASE